MISRAEEASEGLESKLAPLPLQEGDAYGVQRSSSVFLETLAKIFEFLVDQFRNLHQCALLVSESSVGIASKREPVKTCHNGEPAITEQDFCMCVSKAADPEIVIRLHEALKGGKGSLVGLLFTLVS
jgi:hypothetical protein